MWEDALGARRALLEAAALPLGVDDKSMTCALAALWSLSVEEKLRAPMRANGQVWTALLYAAGSNGYDEVSGRARERALGALQYLATEPENQAVMWRDAELRAAIVGAAQDPSAGKAGLYGLSTLWHLSTCQENQE